MYHFYIVQNRYGRVGYGITGNYTKRNKEYIGTSGDLMKFPLVFGGTYYQCVNLEKYVKRKRRSDTWTVGSGRKKWYTEWFEYEVTLECFIEYVKETIEYLNYPLEVVEENYCFGHIE